MLARLPIFTLVASAVAHPPTYGHGPPRNDDLTVQTSSGRVHGKIDSTEPDVRQFLGIPFAHPPTGDLRWAAPQPFSQPDQDVEAKELGPSCMQFLNTNASSVYLNQVLEYNLQGLNRTGDISEDCLRLSVWAPNKEVHRSRGKGKGRGKGRGRGGKAEGLPVLIYFYGGGFSECYRRLHRGKVLTRCSRHRRHGRARPDSHSNGPAHSRPYRSVFQLPRQHLRPP